MKTRMVLLAALLGMLATSACAIDGSGQDELTLPDLTAFAIGTDRNIRSVRNVAADSFNVALREARERGEAWTRDFMQIGLQFVGHDLSGQRREVRVQVRPAEWEPGRSLVWAKVTVVDEGWLDDSVTGERYVIWLVPAGGAHVEVGRALWARLCDRPYWRYYCAESCP